MKTFDTNQEMFDFVVKSVIDQGRPSVVIDDGKARCMYRGEGGTKCAAGFLLEDDEVVENKTIYDVLAAFKTLHGTNTFKLLRDLQCAHDESATTEWPECARATDEEFVTEFKDAARKVAIRHRLEWKFDVVP